MPRKPLPPAKTQTLGSSPWQPQRDLLTLHTGPEPAPSLCPCPGSHRPPSQGIILASAPRVSACLPPYLIPLVLSSASLLLELVIYFLVLTFTCPLQFAKSSPSCVTAYHICGQPWMKGGDSGQQTLDPSPLLCPPALLLWSRVQVSLGPAVKNPRPSGRHTGVSWSLSSCVKAFRDALASVSPVIWPLQLHPQSPL